MSEVETAEQKRPSILPLFVAVLLIPAALGSSKTIFNDGDVSWHIATGQWILDHHELPHTDPFSYTWAGKPWIPIEWLAEVIYASAYRLAGYGGVAAVVTAALIGLHAIVYLNATRWLRLALLPIVAMDFVLIPMMFARPHLLAWPLVAGWTWLMLRARERERAPPIVAALLMTLWANLHGSFVFGFAIAGVFGLEAALASADRMKAVRQWLIFGVACIAAVFINANGVEGVFHPLRFTQLKMLPLIDEWKPSNPGVTPFFFAVLAATLLLVIWKRPRLHPVRWLLLGAFLAAALLQVRHQTTLAIVAAMILPQGFAKGAHLSTAENDRTANFVLAAGAALLVAVRAMLPMSPPDNETNPWKLIAAVPPQLRSQPVLNGYAMGGPLILSGIRPYVDGRGDMYGDELVVGYARIGSGDEQAFADAVRRWSISWAILPNRSKPLIALLVRAGWRRIATDKVGVIYVRPAAAAPSA
jgi:hypothetical protein